MTDINNDGFGYLCKRFWQVFPRTNQLFINNGDLTFTESAAKYSLDIEEEIIQTTFLIMIKMEI